MEIYQIGMFPVERILFICFTQQEILIKILEIGFWLILLVQKECLQEHINLIKTLALGICQITQIWVLCFMMLKNSTQDLSSWCVTKIATAPTNFDTNATAWTLPKPVWGTCPE